jgi:CIC family chloride channel protein
MPHNAIKDNSEPSAEAATRSEIQEGFQNRRQRRNLFPFAALVGLGAGLVSALFGTFIETADNLRNTLILWSAQFPEWGWLFPVLFGATGAGISVFVVRRYAPETSGSGIPHIEAVMNRLRTLNWSRVLPVKFISGILSIGSGLALGREGPTVQMGGAVGKSVSAFFKVSPREQRTLIGAGAGAGLAAAFNAPLSGVMFVLEEIQRDFHPLVFGAVFLAAAIADIVVRYFSGGRMSFLVPNYAALSIASLPFFVLLGCVSGLFGVLYNKSLIGTINLFSLFKGKNKLSVAAFIGAIAGLVGWFSPIAIGSGHSLAEVVLGGNFALSAIPLFFVFRFLLATTSYSTGASGGIFSPLLSLGALLGFAVGSASQYVAPSIVTEPAVFAVVGMAAYFSAIVRAPLTGVALIVEMTGSYQQMLPLLVSCFCAYAIAEIMNNLPIYETLLERDLDRDGTGLNLTEPMLFDFKIEEGAPFSGKKISDLKLPNGCLLIRYVLDGKEHVPMADTILEDHMRITAIIAPEAQESITMIRKGCHKNREPH